MSKKVTKQKKTTIKDIAKAANVSPTTVSLVILGAAGSRVKPTTRQRILEVAETLNYRPNYMARYLVTKKSHLIGLVITTLFRPFYAEITQGIIERAEEMHYGVLARSVRGGVENERRAFNDLLSRGVDGLIVCSALRSDSAVLELVQQEIPFVLINRNVDHGADNQSIDYIGIDNRQGAFMAVDHLLKLGHTKIACVSGPQDFSTGYERQKGYLNALHNHGIPIDRGLMVTGDYSRTAGFDLTLRLIKKGCNFSALFAANDHMAIGALDAFRKVGRDVPGDIAVVGFDDIEMAGLNGVDLTTVTQKKAIMGRMGVDRLMEKLKGEDGEHEKIVILSPHLVIRKTCGFRFAGCRYMESKTA